MPARHHSARPHPWIPWTYFQFLPEAALRGDPLRSLLYLHAQPPLLNALLALALAAEGPLGIDHVTLVCALQSLQGAGAVAALTLLSREFLSGPLRVLFLCLLVWNPALYYFVHIYFYPVHELFYLAWLTLGVVYLVRRPNAPRLLAVVLPVVLLVNTRPLFHPVWGSGILIGATALVWRGAGTRPARTRTRLVVSGALAAMVIWAWPAKNLVVFGSFVPSSWQGVNVATQLTIPKSEWAPAFVYGSRPEQEAVRARLSELVPDAFRKIDVVAAPTKAPGVPNWNHYGLFIYSRERLARAVSQVLEHPEDLLRKASNTYFFNFPRMPLRNPWSDWSLPDLPSWCRRSVRVWEALVAQPLGPPDAPFVVHGLSLWLLFVLPKCVRKSLASTERGRPRRPVVATLLVVVGWVLVMVLLVDGVESNRMRFSIDPFIWMLALFAVTRDRGGSDPSLAA